MGRDPFAAGTSKRRWLSRRPRMLWSAGGGNLALTDVAPVIAVGELSCQFSQIALPDRLATQRAASLLPWRPTIHDDEFYVPRPNVTGATKQ